MDLYRLSQGFNALISAEPYQIVQVWGISRLVGAIRETIWRDSLRPHEE